MLADLQSYIYQVAGPFVILATASVVAVAIVIISIADLRNLFED